MGSLIEDDTVDTTVKVAIKEVLKTLSSPFYNAIVGESFLIEILNSLHRRKR